MDFGNCPKVSIIITTYKRKKEMVVRAVKSAINQTYLNTEIVVVDDSPSDYLHREDVRQAILALGDERIKVIWHDISKGACAARNTGLAAATGEYIGFLDDDDEWIPEKIEKMLPGFDSEAVALVYCARYIVWPETGETYLQEHEKCVGKVFDNLILRNFIGSTSFPLLRTEVLRELGGFDPELPAAQDFDVWLRIASRYEVNYIDVPLVRYYVHAGDRITKNPIKKIAGLERVYGKHSAYLKKNRKARAITYFNLCEPYAVAALFRKAFWLFVKAFVLYPTCGRRMIPPLKSIGYNILHKRRRRK